MNTLAFLSLSVSEMLVIGVVALLVFGGRLPEVMRNLGRTYAKFRHGMSEITNPLRQEMRRLDVTTPDTALPTPSRTAAPASEPGAPAPRYEPVEDVIPDDGRREPRMAPHAPVSGGAADEPPPV